MKKKEFDTIMNQIYESSNRQIRMKFLDIIYNATVSFDLPRISIIGAIDADNDLCLAFNNGRDDTEQINDIEWIKILNQ